jgi:hypothetical protein
MPDPPPAMQGEIWAGEAQPAPMPFSLGEALDEGVRGLRRHGVVLTAAQVLASLPGAAAALAMRLELGQPRFGSHAYWKRTLVLAAAGAVLGALFRGGLVAMALDAARGRTPRLSDLARGARYFPAMLAFEAAHAVILAVSVPLLFVPYVLVWTGVALAPFALVDRAEGIASAVRWSFPAARGERLHLFGFLVATAVVSYLGVLACCVGAFPAAALTSVATAHVYLCLRGMRLTGSEGGEGGEGGDGARGATETLAEGKGSGGGGGA